MSDSSNLQGFPYWETVLDKTQQPDGLNWRHIYADRQRMELDFAELYARDFHHGTTGHNQLMLIGSLAELIDFILARYLLVKKD